MLEWGLGHTWAHDFNENFFNKTLAGIKKCLNSCIRNLGIKKPNLFIFNPLDMKLKEQEVNNKLNIIKYKWEENHENNSLWNKCKQVYEKYKNIKKPLRNNQQHYKNFTKDLRLDTEKWIIKPADKGNRVVIMDKSHYMMEVSRQLSDKNTYKPVSTKQSMKHWPKIRNLIDQLENKGFINKTQKNKLWVDRNKDFEERTFYILPKIHKEQKQWIIQNKMPKGRPVVAYTNSDLYQISKFIDFHLNKMAKRTDSYIKNTEHCIRHLKALNLEKNKKFVIATADVENLYPSIEPNWGLENIKQSMKEFTEENRPDTEILELLEIALKNNDFLFGSRRFLQIKGTAMGAPFSPAYANLVLHLWEKPIIEKYKHSILFYGRYIDDIIIIIKNEENELQRLKEELNNRHPNIKLTWSDSNNSITFLDLNIEITKENTISWEIYFKDTDSRALLDLSSNHPKHVFTGVLYSQLTRYMRNCKDPKQAIKHFNDLIKINKNKGYNRRMRRITLKRYFNKNNNKTKYNWHLCSSCRCKVCNLAGLEKSLINWNNTTEWKLEGEVSCHTQKIIYALQCQKCKKLYVGLTIHNMKVRWASHTWKYNSNNEGLLYKHMREHGLNQMKIYILKTCPEQEDNQLASFWLHREESKIIHYMETLAPMGLNTHDGFTGKEIIPLVIPWSHENSRLAKEIKEIITEEFPNKKRTDMFRVTTAYTLAKSNKQIFCNKKVDETMETLLHVPQADDTADKSDDDCNVNYFQQNTKILPEKKRKLHNLNTVNTSPKRRKISNIQGDIRKFFTSNS